MLVPEAKEISLGLQAYQETIAQETASSNRALVQMVQRVGQRIAAVSQRDDFQWEFNLISDPQTGSCDVS